SGDAIALHIGVDEIEQTIRISETRCPNTAGIGITKHVQLARAIQRPCEQSPMNQIARVVNLDAREPLEGRGCNVVVIADTHDGWVGIEAGENWVPDDTHAVACCAAGLSRTTAHSIVAPMRSSTPRQMKNGAYPMEATSPPIAREKRRSPALPMV